MSVKTVRRIASQLLKVGENKVVIKPGNESRINETLTREDVRALIKEGIITKKEVRGVSRARARKHAEQRKKGRRKGPGNRKGRRKGIDKKVWMARVRAQRRLLREIEDSLIPGVRRRLYYMIKGGMFKSKAALLNYVKENGMLKEGSKL